MRKLIANLGVLKVSKFQWVLVFFALGVVPAGAAEGFFFSLGNTDFVVLIAFIAFVGVIIYFKAPKFVAKLIDNQIAQIDRQLKEAASIRNDALEMQQNLEQKEQETTEAVKEIKQQAEKGKELAISEAEVAIQKTLDRKLQNAREQILASEEKAKKAIKNQAVDIAVNTASKIIQNSMGGDDRREIIAQSIKDIETRLN